MPSPHRIAPRPGVLRATALLTLLTLGPWAAAPAPARSTPGQEGEAAVADTDGDILARIGDEPITRAEIERAAADTLEQIRFELLQCRTEAEKGRHETLEATARSMVRERLLDREASEREITEGELLSQEVDEQVAEVTQDDIAAFYEENRARIGERSLEQIGPQIETVLRQQRETEAYERFISALELQYEVSYAIEPYRVELDIEGEPSKGPEEAPVTMVEFSDFECPFCARILPTLERVEEEYGEQVRFVFKQFPLRNLHPHAQTAAEASLCARDQGKFWELHDAMFADQDALEAEDIRVKAEEAGLAMDAFSSCLESGRYTEAVDEDLREGTVAGISGTPALFINGRPLSGAVPYDKLVEVIEDELARASP